MGQVQGEQVRQLGKSAGSIRHWHPLFKRYSTPQKTSYKSTVRGLVRRRADSNVGRIRANCSRLRRRALRVSRPAREKKRRLRVLVVSTGSPRPMRVVQRASNCVGCQERWAISAGHEPRHVELFLTMAFRMVSSLRMQATKATFFALPAASSLW